MLFWPFECVFFIWRRLAISVTSDQGGRITKAKKKLSVEIALSIQSSFAWIALMGDC
jgi:hypothetical protein